MIAAPALGVDWGASKIGLALSEHGKLARSHSILRVSSRADACAQIARACERERIATIVLGVPYQEDKTDTGVEQKYNRIAAEILRACEQIANYPTPRIVLEPEQYTTSLAQPFLSRAQRKSGADDAKAAEILLQTYLDRNA